MPAAIAEAMNDGVTHLILDAVLIRTNRGAAINPNTGHDLWYSGQHQAHDGNIQVPTNRQGWVRA